MHFPRPFRVCFQIDMDFSQVCVVVCALGWAIRYSDKARPAGGAGKILKRMSNRS